MTTKHINSQKGGTLRITSHVSKRNVQTDGGEYPPPQSDILDTTEWFQFFNQAGLNLIQFLLSKKQQKLLKIDEEICALREKLNPNKGDDDYNKRPEALKKHLEKEETEQRNKNKNKQRCLRL